MILFGLRTEKGVASVEINGKNYYDNSSGILRSEEKVHKVTSSPGRT